MVRSLAQDPRLQGGPTAGSAAAAGAGAGPPPAGGVRQLVELPGARGNALFEEGEDAD